MTKKTFMLLIRNYRQSEICFSPLLIPFTTNNFYIFLLFCFHLLSLLLNNIYISSTKKEWNEIYAKSYWKIYFMSLIDRIKEKQKQKREKNILFFVWIYFTSRWDVKKIRKKLNRLWNMKMRRMDLNRIEWSFNDDK
jgi:uncharacterized protein YbgA (DUF1722 family)